MSYIIFGSEYGFDLGLLRKIFEREGLHAARINDTDIKAMWISTDDKGKYDHRAYTIKCKVKNILDISSMSNVIDKYKLYLTMTREFPALQCMSPTMTLRELARTYTPGQIYILRPVGRGFYAGHGIKRIGTRAELDSAIKSYGNRLINSVIASVYIRDIYLFMGRKFHLRMYALYTPHNNKVVVWNCGEILTAGTRYNRDNYKTIKNNDSHASTTNGLYLFPQDCDTNISTSIPTNEAFIARNAFVQINKIARAAFMNAKGKPYPESLYGFEVYGLDILPAIVHGKMRMILLEINERIGYSIPFPCKKTTDMQRALFEWIYHFGYAPLL